MKEVAHVSGLDQANYNYEILLLKLGNYIKGAKVLQRLLNRPYGLAIWMICRGALGPKGIDCSWVQIRREALSRMLGPGNLHKVPQTRLRNSTGRNRLIPKVLVHGIRDVNITCA